MPEKEPTAYDVVTYPGLSFSQTHPDRLATIAALYGLPAAPPERCRVLELGCGTGEVAFWVAQKTPAKMLGTDLCAPFIASAKEKYQLENLRYEVRDLRAPDSFLGERFDYIIGNSKIR